VVLVERSLDENEDWLELISKCYLTHIPAAGQWANCDEASLKGGIPQESAVTSPLHSARLPLVAIDPGDERTFLGLPVACMMVTARPEHSNILAIACLARFAACKLLASQRLICHRLLSTLSDSQTTSSWLREHPALVFNPHNAVLPNVRSSP
jgi:hypothetical protein